MEFKFPKNDEKYFWTNHVGRKMMFYGLSADRIKRVMRSPKRSEKGVADGTIAVMQPAGSKARPSEVWVMYAISKKSRTLSLLKGSHESLDKLGTIAKNGNRKIIITAWRYPGISPVRDEIPIPIDILEELKREGIIKL
jgi:hypothetical protein